LTFIEGAPSAFHFFQDVGGPRGPDERFRTLVVTVDVSADGHDEFFQVTEDAPAKPILSQVANFGIPIAGISEGQLFGGIPYLEQPPTGILGGGRGGNPYARMIQLKVQLQF
jgi:hypothetical protein